MTNSKAVSEKQVIFLEDEVATARFAAKLAQACEASGLYEKGVMIYLKGDLGAGKSFFSRAFVQHFLPGQKVKSPTYTIVESYNFCKFTIHHLDLYRLCDPEELEYLAIRDLLSKSYVALVEWPQKGGGFLPSADIEITLGHKQSGRQLELQALSKEGQQLLRGLPEF